MFRYDFYKQNPTYSIFTELRKSGEKIMDNYDYSDQIFEFFVFGRSFLEKFLWPTENSTETKFNILEISYIFYKYLQIRHFAEIRRIFLLNFGTYEIFQKNSKHTNVNVIFKNKWEYWTQKTYMYVHPNSHPFNVHYYYVWL